MTAPNEHIAQIFDLLANVCTRKAAEVPSQSALRFKAKQFEHVAAAVRVLTTTVHSADAVKDVRGFGKGTLRRIDEILETGTLAELEGEGGGGGSGGGGGGSDGGGGGEATRRRQVRADLQRVTGIGPRKAQTLEAQGVTLANLLASTEATQTAYHLTDHQRLGLRFYHDLQHRIPHAVIASFETVLKSLLADDYDFDFDDGAAQAPRSHRGRAVICGSYRRNAPDSGDIDLLFTHDTWQTKAQSESGLRTLLGILREADLLVADITPEPHTKYMGFVRVPHYAHVCRLDIRAVAGEHYVPSALYFTGSQGENIRMRRKALSMGLKLSEYGLVDAKTSAGIACATEQALYDTLQEEYRAPSER